MKKILSVVLPICVVVLIFGSCTQTVKQVGSDYLVAAYIWPSCHNDTMGERVLWPEKTGEWEIVKKGDPRFKGHYQPKQPLWGYELDDYSICRKIYNK